MTRAGRGSAQTGLELGISRSAWINVCEVLGRHHAATAVAIMHAKHPKGKTGPAPLNQGELCASLHRGDSRSYIYDKSQSAGVRAGELGY